MMIEGRRNRYPIVVKTICWCLLLLPLHVKGETIWVQASQAKHLQGPLVLGQETGVLEEGALGDFLVSAVSVKEGDFRGGYAEYQVKIPQAATYYIWARLRYPFGVDDSFAFIPEGEQPTDAMSRCLGNSGVGVRQWHWDSQGTGRQCTPGTGRLSLNLPAGDFTFRIYPREARARRGYKKTAWPARPMFNPRLNVLCLTTDANYVPTDTDAQQSLNLQVPTIDWAAHKVKTPTFPEIADQALKSFGKKRIPDWLRCPRFFTKDSWREEVQYRQPGDMAFMVRQIAANGGNAFRVGGYWGGDAYFQSKVTPHAPGLGSLDFLREAIDEGKRTGVKIVMYMNPTTLYADHPLWPEVAIHDADGKPSTQGYLLIPGSPVICNNHPRFREFLKDFLTEVFTEYGPDGLYVDGLGAKRCFCQHCQKMYQSMFGVEMPVQKFAQHSDWKPGWWEMSCYPFPVGVPRDPDVQRYTAFFHQNQIELMKLVSETVKSCKPDAAVIIHTWPKAETVQSYDATLTEIYIEEPWQHHLWKFGELANYSNIFPVPVLFNIYVRDHGTQADARIKMFQGLANGCFPNTWSLVGMKPVFQFMQDNAEYYDFMRTLPTKSIAFVRGIIDSPAQDAIKTEADPTLQPVHDRFLAPYVGMYSAMVRSGLPVISLQQHDFHQRLDGFKVLCLANEASLSTEQMDRIRQFVGTGGGLIATHETSLYDEKGNRRDDFGLADMFGIHYQGMLPANGRKARFDNAHPVTAGLNAEQSIAHDDVHVVTRLGHGKPLAMLEGDDLEDGPVPAVVVQKYGYGRVAYLPGRLDAIQCDEPNPAIERLFAKAVRWVADGDIPVQVEAPAPVNVSLFDQPGRRILHLINLNGDTRYRNTEIEPVENVHIQMQVPSGYRIERLRRLWDQSNVMFESDGNTVQFTLGRIGEYEVVVADWENTVSMPEAKEQADMK